jgi:23S rRNA (cytosine1962-C5)-methyltransferase
MDLAPLRLLKQHDRRLRAGHMWVFSNEVDTRATPLTSLEPGQPVRIEDSHGHTLGSAYANPHALICARLVSRNPKYHLDRSLIVHRLNVALALRARWYPAPYYRLVFGESDGLPGLVVDRYGDYLVAQITTAGMERLKDEVVDALLKVLRPAGILLRNDSGARALEQLESYVAVVHGAVPERVAVEEHGASFEVAPATGQKTGWFFDQYSNRQQLAHYVRDARVLDLFSYVGAWGVRAATAGAKEVLCGDSSANALEAVQANAERNGVGALVRTHKDDAFELLRQLRAEREHFDVVIVDPPAFIKRKKDAGEGLKAYHRLNQMALQVLGKDGVLVSCSCSYHLQRDKLLEVMQGAARHIDRFMQIVEQGHQAPDHPVHPAIPETEYLKAFFARVTPS